MSTKRPSSFAALYDLDRKKSDLEKDHGLPDDRSLGDRTTAPDDRTTTTHESEVSQDTDDRVAGLPDDRTTGRPDDRAIVNSEALWRSRIDRQKLGIRLPKNKVEIYKEWCFRHKLDLQDAIEAAMDLFIGLPDDRSTGRPGSRATDVTDYRTTGRPIDHDSDDHDLTDENIIRLFETTIEIKYKKERDEGALAKIRQHSKEVAEAGFIIARLRAKSKINSMNYCVPVIEEVAHAGINDGATYLHYLRAKLKNAR